MIDYLTTFAEVVGASCIAVGIGLAFGFPFGLISAGVLILAGSYFVAGIGDGE